MVIKKKQALRPQSQSCKNKDMFKKTCPCNFVYLRKVWTSTSWAQVFVPVSPESKVNNLKFKCSFVQTNHDSKLNIMKCFVRQNLHQITPFDLILKFWMPWNKFQKFENKRGQPLKAVINLHWTKQIPTKTFTPHVYIYRATKNSPCTNIIWKQLL